MTSPTASTPRLLADIGGTNARFAWQPGPGHPITEEADSPTAAHATLEDAICAYLVSRGLPAPTEAAIAIATPITGDQVRMTNHPWSFSRSAVQRRFGLARLEVLNDFTALALALPGLAPEDREAVGGGEPVADAAIGLIGPGTGLGVSGLVPDGQGGWTPLQGEGGHATLAACSDREAAVLERLARHHGHVSGERAISGSGLVDLHAALWSIDRPGEPVPTRDAAAIGQAAVAGSDPACVEAVDLMCAFLGTMAGNLALTLGARGGVYIGGGIVPRLGARFASSPFRERFEAKGRFRDYLAAIPVWVIRARRSPALAGAANALDRPAVRRSDETRSEDQA